MHFQYNGFRYSCIHCNFYLHYCSGCVVFILICYRVCINDTQYIQLSLFSTTKFYLFLIIYIS